MVIVTRFKKFAGISLIEFMIALVVGSFMSLAVFNMMVQFEEGKRAVTTSGEADLTGMYIIDRLDRDIRSSGSGFTGGGRLVSGGIGSTHQYFHGCLLNVSSSGVAVLPAAASFATPFNAVPQEIRLAPVVIVDGGVSAGGNPLNDVIVVASGGGSHIESVQTLSVAPTQNSITVGSGVGVRANDLILLAQSEVTGSEIVGTDCVVTQVANDYVTAAGKNVNVTLQADGAHYQDPGPFGINALSVWSNLGQSMQLIMYGVNANNDFLVHDLMTSVTANGAGQNPQLLSENVISLQAIYGVDNGAGVNWVSATGDYSATNLMAGTADASALMLTIKAVRLAVVVQTSESAKNKVSNDEVSVFDAVNQSLEVTLPDNQFRYSVKESVIPLRNIIGLRGNQ